jgi:GalNAc5-diNAcBac-PP-undecaprenol beta-1,3-glucosyltransferase
MNDKPLISIVIATYKRSGLVPRAIESVRKQTYHNVEILVVDDGSPDNTQLVVESIPDNRIRYIHHEKNKGLPAARNTGIRAAQGEYIAFLDDDDEWREHKLERQLQAIEHFDAVVCSAFINGRPRSVHNRPNVTLDDLKDYIPDPSGLLVKASVIKELLFDESLREGEDWDAFIRIALRFTIGFVEESLVLYNDGGHQRMTNEAKDQTAPELENNTAVLHKHRNLFGEKWFKYHLARKLTSHIQGRRNKLLCIGYAVRRCGIVPVVAVMADKIRRQVRALTVDRA